MMQKVCVFRSAVLESKKVPILYAFHFIIPHLVKYTTHRPIRKVGTNVRNVVRHNVVVLGCLRLGNHIYTQQNRAVNKQWLINTILKLCDREKMSIKLFSMAEIKKMNDL